MNNSQQPEDALARFMDEFLEAVVNQLPCGFWVAIDIDIDNKFLLLYRQSQRGITNMDEAVIQYIVVCKQLLEEIDMREDDGAIFQTLHSIEVIFFWYIYIYYLHVYVFKTIICI